jgi:prepilin-type N-terminal cleavage/methylation domain-containing protein
MKRQQNGFTLVEIAIVLVIIGLLLGGILKGQEMITQAKIKNAVADFSGISAAYYGYQDRYRAIPGDDPNAATRWTGAAISATAGEPGNGVVQGLYNSATAGDESRLWWDHLRRAGLLAGSGTQQPYNALAGIIGVQTGDGAAGGALGIAAGVGGFSGLIVCSANLIDKIGTAVDTQMDDGVRSTGGVRGQLQAAPNPAIVQDATAAAVGGANSYQETGTNTYALCRAF